MMDSRNKKKTLINERKSCNYCLVIIFILGLGAAVLIPFYSLAYFQNNVVAVSMQCGNSCSISLAETIPENVTFPEGSPTHVSTFTSWEKLIAIAEESIDIASYYWTLRTNDIQPTDGTSWMGQKIFDDLVTAGTKRGIKIRIAVDISAMTTNDTIILEDIGAAEVRYLDFKKLIGKGILHTKMWLVDGKHFAMGSANLDWRSLVQVKELSAVIYDCQCYGDDMNKIFSVYWNLGKPGAKIPSEWPSYLSTSFNKDTPLQVMFNDSMVESYLSSSPPPFCPRGRTTDIDAILDVMYKAKKFIYISVMDYQPMTIFDARNMYWNGIDGMLRSMAMDRRVKVRLMTGYWNHTYVGTSGFLQSLAALNNTGLMDVEVKQFIVPLNGFQVPYSRVNHCKFMVTDNAAYVGTSNWSEDYFVSTGGIGLIVNNTALLQNSSLQSQLQLVFERDWFSQYASFIKVPPDDN